MSRRAKASIVASPALVGAVTVLVVIVSVFLAYNANQGLPFVPTYNVSAELPGGANLVAANEVRVGGFRVGIVERIRPQVNPDYPGRATAVIDMKLDKAIEPLPKDTRVAVRPRSALGLKYVALTPGRSAETYAAGDTIPLSSSAKPIEIDEFFSTFNAEYRVNVRTALEGYGSAFAGRGQAINRTIEELVPFTRYLEPVFENLSHPDTALNVFFRRAARVSGEIAPVAASYASLFSNMATTFEALSRSPRALQATVEKGPPTLDAGIRSFPVQRPFLSNAETLFRRLEPVAEEIQQSLPGLADALRVGRPVQRRAPQLYERTDEVFASLRRLVRNPNTLLALTDLTTTVQVAAPLVTWVAPFQSVCNYWNYYWSAIGEHVSEPVRFGTIQRTALKSDNRQQAGRVSTSDSSRPVDVPKSMDHQTSMTGGQPLQALHRQAYQPAVDAQGNADCQAGQSGYMKRLVTGSRYPPSDNPAELGGSHVVLDTETPGLSGGTYKARELGIKSLEDVP